MTKKKKMLWMVELLDHLSDMYIYIEEIAEEEGVDISYDDVKNIIKELKELVNKVQDKE